MRPVEEIAGELYTLPPAKFTGARDAAVASARRAGDTDTARRLAALRRPTHGAHLVNLLALHRPEVVAELIALGEEIRAAQGIGRAEPRDGEAAVSPARVRDLSTRRRSTIAAALRVCRALAAEAGSGEPTAQQLGEAEATLAAAMADSAAADQVRSGRVVKALSYAGFGGGFGAIAPVRAPGGATVRSRPPAVPTAEAEPEAPPEPEAGAPPEPAAGAATVAARRRAERAAWQRLARAEAGLATAQEQERAAGEEMDRIADEITRLRAALEAASKRARGARTGRQAAERELARARREAPSTQEDEE